MAVAFNPLAIAADLAQCVEVALKDEARGEDAWVGQCCVRPGSQVAWDTCCENQGQAWVVLKTGHPTTTFPTMDTRHPATICSEGVVSLVLTFEIGVLRCVCAADCDCDTVEAEAARAFGDLGAVFKAINCCFDAAEDCGDPGWRLNTFEMVGPSGGCAGSTVSLSVHTELPCCPNP